MSFLRAIIEAIKDFFSAIFFPSAPETVRRKNLKLIFNKLHDLPFLPISKDLMVSADFAKLLFRIFAEVLPVKSIFEQTIMSKDVRIANKFIDMLITGAFSENQQKAFATFSYSERELDLQKEAASAIDVIQRRLKEQVKRFHSFQHDLRTPEVTKMEQNIQHIFALYDFCCFDFENLFSHFGDFTAQELLNMVSDGSMPQFKDVPAGEILQELLDFNFVKRNLVLDEELTLCIQQMHEKIAGSAENKFLFVLQQIDAIKTIIDKELPEDTVLNMIRYAKGDPFFDEQTPFTETPVVSDFDERLEARFSADSKKLLHVFQESKIDKLVKDTFGTRKFFSFSGYNEEVNKRLQATTSLSFDWIRPMELLRTFIKQNFEVNMKLFIKTILVEGFFSDNNYQKALGAAFYYCENLSDRFEQFERLFANGASCSLSIIENLLIEIDQGRNLEKQLEKMIDEANSTAKSIVQTSVEQYTDLYTTCSQLLADSKKHNADLITNIKPLFASAKLRPLTKNFENDVQTLGKFLEIMKNYAILVRMDVA